jgi:hypothetical protein
MRTESSIDLNQLSFSELNTEEDTTVATASDDIMILEESEHSVEQVREGKEIIVVEGAVEEETPAVEAVDGRVEEETLVVEAVEGEVEEETLVVEELVIEEVQVGQEGSQLMVELELDQELEAGSPEVTVEDVTKQELSEIRSDPRAETESEMTPEHVTSSLESPQISTPETHLHDVDADNDVDDAELKPNKERETPSRNKPLCHVISAVYLLLAMLDSVGEEHLPTQTEAALSSLFLSYLLIYAAADQEILIVDQLSDWLNTAFNLVVGPYLITSLGYTLVTSWGVCKLGANLGVLLGVEMWVLQDHLQPDKIAKGFVFVTGLFILNDLFLLLGGEAGPAT